MKDNIEFVNLIQGKSLDIVVSVLTAEWRLKQSCKGWLTITMCRVESITEKNFANYLSLKILLADAFFEYSPSQTYWSQTSLKCLSWSSQRIKSLSITCVRQWWRMCAGTGDQVMPPVTTRLITGPAEPFYLLLPQPLLHHITSCYYSSGCRHREAKLYYWNPSIRQMFRRYSNHWWDKTR